VTYLVLNAAFTIAALTMTHLFRGKTSFKYVLFTAAAILVFTMFGDNYIVGSGIVAYDVTKILGLKMGTAPIEDFAYAVVAAFVVPVLWNALGKRK